MDAAKTNKIINKITQIINLNPVIDEPFLHRKWIKQVIAEHTKNLTAEEIKHIEQLLRLNPIDKTQPKPAETNIFRPLVEVNSQFESIDPEMEQHLFLLADECEAELKNLITITAITELTDADLCQELVTAIPNIINNKNLRLNKNETNILITLIKNNILYLGAFELLLNNPLITDILVNNSKEVYVEINGVLKQTSIKFKSEAALLNLIQRIAFKTGKKVDYSQPFINGALADGSRINIIIPPLSKYPTMSIRLFNNNKLSINQLINTNMLSSEMAAFLAIAVKAELNIVISGGTGSGKTTLLNALSWAIDDNERIITIEDTAELQLKKPHTVSLVTQNQGEITFNQRELLVNALRMRPDRIIVGEVRGGEAFELLQAMNTGHDGSISSIHANNANNVISRLTNMILMANLEINESSIKNQIFENIDLIVHIARNKNGQRVISSISQITKTKVEDLFVFDNNKHLFIKPNEINATVLNKLTKASLLENYQKISESLC